MWPKPILGIDAAWTTTQPSGVALLDVPGHGASRVIRVARSYSEFVDGPPVASGWLEPATNRPVTIEAVISAAADIAGALPGVVALDIPLAAVPIAERRASDNAVSREYGGRWASTHSPTPTRPGAVSAKLFAGMSALGYSFASATAVGYENTAERWFIETYPHPAIIDMMSLQKRLPYKVARMRRYWPDVSARERWPKLGRQLERLRDELAERIDGVKEAIPEPNKVFEQGWRRRRTLMKGIEDALDAVVCAYVGMAFVRGQARPLGDGESAIWLPAGNSSR